MYEGWLIFGVAVSNIASGLYAARVAESKQLPQWTWFVGGLCFGVIALLAVGFCERWDDETRPGPFTSDDDH